MHGTYIRVTPKNVHILLKIKTLIPFLGYFVVITDIVQVLRPKEPFDTRNVLQCL